MNAIAYTLASRPAAIVGQFGVISERDAMIP
jgi:hypothetical protein